MTEPVERIFREQWGRVLAALIGILGDFDLAEEAAQEAFAIAEGRRLLARALAISTRGPYVIQAAIASLTPSGRATGRRSRPAAAS